MRFLHDYNVCSYSLIMLKGFLAFVEGVEALHVLRDYFKID